MALHFLVESASDARVGEIVTLTGAEAKHAAVVRRLRVGEAVTVGDGRGVWLSGIATEVSASRVDVRVSARDVEAHAERRITLVQALAKGDRDELAVQASCELGIDAIVPWQAARSVSRWEGPKAAKGRERWATIVREAAKQSHRRWVPEVSPVMTTPQLTENFSSSRLLVLVPGADTRLSAIDDDGRDIVLVVGPEGGISDAELERLRAAGAEAVRLGESVLRTSTAGPAAIAVLSARLGRW